MTVEMADREKESSAFICGMLSLYSPPESLLTNIATYIDYIDKLFVVDNSPDNNNTICIDLLAQFPHVEIVTSEKNIGIAGALNRCISLAKKENYLWMLTMDQDSYFDKSQASRFFYSLPMIDKARVAIISPSHEEVGAGIEGCEYQKTDSVMTSGNLLNLSLVEKIGMFDEDLFIDCVDHDYCLRAKLSGLDVFQAKNCSIEHEVGTPYNGSFLWGCIKRRFHIHSPKRMYFIVRNSLYMNKKYRNAFPEYMSIHNKEVFHKISKTLRYGNNRALCLKYIIKGYLDYYGNKYGNRVDI